MVRISKPLSTGGNSRGWKPLSIGGRAGPGQPLKRPELHHFIQQITNFKSTNHWRAQFGKPRNTEREQHRTMITLSTE
eukprot:275437-Hanusia_phi.AAC.1